MSTWRVWPQAKRSVYASCSVVCEAEQSAGWHRNRAGDHPIARLPRSLSMKCSAMVATQWSGRNAIRSALGQFDGTDSIPSGRRSGLTSCPPPASVSPKLTRPTPGTSRVKGSSETIFVPFGQITVRCSLPIAKPTQLPTAAGTDQYRLALAVQNRGLVIATRCQEG